MHDWNGEEEGLQKEKDGVPHSSRWTRRQIRALIVAAALEFIAVYSSTGCGLEMRGNWCGRGVIWTLGRTELKQELSCLK